MALQTRRRARVLSEANGKGLNTARPSTANRRTSSGSNLHDTTDDSESSNSYSDRQKQLNEDKVSGKQQDTTMFPDVSVLLKYVLESLIKLGNGTRASRVEANRKALKLFNSYLKKQGRSPIGRARMSSVINNRKRAYCAAKKMMKHTGLKYSCKYNRIAASQAQIKAHCEGIRLISSREILAGSSQVHFFNEFREIDEVLGDCVFKNYGGPDRLLGCDNSARLSLSDSDTDPKEETEVTQDTELQDKMSNGKSDSNENPVEAPAVPQPESSQFLQPAYTPFFQPAVTPFSQLTLSHSSLPARRLSSEEFAIVENILVSASQADRMIILNSLMYEDFSRQVNNALQYYSKKYENDFADNIKFLAYSLFNARNGTNLPYDQPENIGAGADITARDTSPHLEPEMGEIPLESTPSKSLYKKYESSFLQKDVPFANTHEIPFLSSHQKITSPANTHSFANPQNDSVPVNTRAEPTLGLKVPSDSAPASTELANKGRKVTFQIYNKNSAKLSEQETFQKEQPNVSPEESNTAPSISNNSENNPELVDEESEDVLPSPISKAIPNADQTNDSTNSEPGRKRARNARDEKAGSPPSSSTTISSTAQGPNGSANHSKRNSRSPTKNATYYRNKLRCR